MSQRETPAGKPCHDLTAFFHSGSAGDEAARVVERDAARFSITRLAETACCFSAPATTWQSQFLSGRRKPGDPPSSSCGRFSVRSAQGARSCRSSSTANPVEWLMDTAFDGGTRVTRAQLSGKPVDLMLDTGNQGGTQLWERFARDFPAEMNMSLTVRQQREPASVTPC